MNWKWLVVILVYASVGAATPPEAGLCEAEVSLEARAVINIVKASVLKTDISPLEVQYFLDGAPSPYGGTLRRPETLNTKNTFNRNFVKLPPEQQKIVRAQLDVFIKQKTGDAVKTDETREKTKFAFAPKVSVLPVDFAMTEPLFPSSAGEWNGRPIFIGFYEGNAGDKPSYVLMDPTHPEEKNRVVKLGEIANGGRYTHQTSIGAITIPKGEKTYSLFPGFKQIFELEGRKQVSYSEVGLESIQNYRVRDNILLVETLYGLVMYLSVDYPQELVEIYLGRPNAKPRTVTKGDIIDLNSSVVNGKRFVTFVTRANLDNEIYHMEPGGSPKLVATVHGDPVAKTRIFADQGKLFLMYVQSIQKIGYENLSVGVVDLSNNQSRYFDSVFDAKMRYEFAVRDKTPYFFTSSGDKIIQGNLRTMELSDVTKEHFRMGAIRYFEYQGVQYLAWRNGARRIEIMDLSTGLIVTSQLPEEMFEMDLFFDERGLPTLLIQNNEKPPYLLNIFTESLRGGR